MPAFQFYTVEDIKMPFQDKKKYSTWLITVAQSEQKTIDYINYIFCSDEYLKDINIKYLNHDYYTDIITFPYKEGDFIQSDIYISIDRVTDNAREYDVSLDKELQRVMVHGLLHLIGYNDVSDDEVAVMREKEDQYIGAFPG